MDGMKNINGATPVSDTSGLIPSHIQTQKELNEWEHANIVQAAKKYLSKQKIINITIDWLKQVHKDMFDETWEWAGQFRKSDLTIGVDKQNIPEELKKLTDDINYWRENPDFFSILEQSVHIHHRLVQIHAFPNGNGRHSRLVADIFLFSKGCDLPVWPDQSLIKKTDIRKDYIKALQQADKGDYKLLMQFTQKLIIIRDK